MVVSTITLGHEPAWAINRDARVLERRRHKRHSAAGANVARLPSLANTDRLSVRFPAKIAIHLDAGRPANPCYLKQSGLVALCVSPWPLFLGVLDGNGFM
jgi:hypothetical protein